MNASAFELPSALEAREPPEARGVARDEVKLMTGFRSTGRIEHERFRELPGLLSPGDLLVLNVSATIPAAVPARRTDGTSARVHFSTRAPRLGERWRVVELRSADGSQPARGRAGERITFAGSEAWLELFAPYASSARLMLARLAGPLSVEEYLRRHGEPIRYGYVPRSWPLETYQTVYATAPGSAEMPSAGRPFSSELITRLVARGVLIAPITLHTGVSSPERHEPPFAEQFAVPEVTARLVNAAREARGRVIAVGTTVVRALETVSEPSGRVRPAEGWTGLVITPERGVRVVDGLITGWHEPAASHLQTLEAIGGRELLGRCYQEALRNGYLWHEFGDSHLILP
jgi:S-adenosylmethionine:tRNA ribosyltransferase-isomerase